MKGFTLVELLVSIGIIGLLTASAVPFARSFQTSSDISSQANTILTTLRRAELDAMSGERDSAWGVYFDDSAKQFVLFKGTDFAGRDQSFDLAATYPSRMHITTDFGVTMTFSSGAGVPSASGTVMIADQENQSATILITQIGRIERQ